MRGGHPEDIYGDQMYMMANVLVQPGAIEDVIAYIDTSALRRSFRDDRNNCRNNAAAAADTDSREEAQVMAYVAIADRDHHLHDPQTFIEKYVWSQDHKVIAIQYGSVAIGVGLVALGAVAAHAAADRVPRNLRVHHAVQVLRVRDHARHDHGHLLAHGAVPRRLRQLPDSAHVRRPGHGVSVHEHAELLGLPAVRHRAAVELLRAGWPDWRRLDAVPAADRPRRHAEARNGASC